MTTPSADQAAFLATLRSALGLAADTDGRRREHIFGQPISPGSQNALDTVRSRGRADRLALLEIFRRQAGPLNLTVTTVADTAAAGRVIADLVAATAPEWGTMKTLVRWDHPLLAALDLETRLAEARVPVFTTRLTAGTPVDRQRQKIRRRVEDAYIGVTAADFCLADTATLVMKTRPGQARAVSLVPSIHVAVVRLEQMLVDLKELYALLRWDPAQRTEGLSHHLVMISGPSKTADIELVMVHGAHGPRAVHVVVITGEQRSTVSA